MDGLVSEAATGRVRRRLAAILVAGYTRLFPGEEREHFAELRSFLTGVIEPRIIEFGGNIFKEASELVVAAFGNAVTAVRCAAARRDEVAQRNRPLAEEERIAIRIGINFGDIIVEEGDVLRPVMLAGPPVKTTTLTITSCASGT